MSKPHLVLAHAYWKEHLKPNDLAIDMTCGNGHDTLYLASLLPQGKVHGFDIQPAAIENTRARLGPAIERVTLWPLCHTKIEEIPFSPPPRLIVYNLGYLPGGDKSITTQTKTTIQSLERAFSLLEKRGALSITCYPGHEEGAREQEAIKKWVERLSGAAVLVHEWGLKTPSLVWVIAPAS